MAIDAAVAEPRLGRRDRAVGHLGAALAGELAHGEAGVRLPGQVVGPAAQLMRAGQIQKRRQRGPRLDRAGGDQLGDRQQLDLRLVLVQWCVGQHVVGGA